MINIITHPIFLWSLFVFIISGIGMWIASYFVASHCVYNATLRRRSKEQWSREMPNDLPEDSKRMYQQGLAWSTENSDKKKDVHIINSDGLNLYGEYYDFGNNKCVMILSGRTESLRYGYFFAIPYAQNEYNVLVFDPRAHGMSDGEFNTVGFEESKDILCWVNFLQDNFGIRSIVFHGICIGAAAGIFALTSDACPDCVEGIITEGMFPNFAESMKNHLIERKKPVFILYDMINAKMKKHTGHSMNYGPIDVISKLDKPLLMLHSKEDLYSTPQYAQKLYDLARTEKKSLVWFEHGRHSMLRITDTERYDSAISEFLNYLSTVKVK